MVRRNQVDSMLTVRQVSRLLHIHINTVRRWSNRGILKAYRIGPRGDRRFRQEDIALLLLEQTRGTPQEQKQARVN
ncbi:helix-turn-helix domain-containing protein [Chloroflexota bacterium]